MFAMAQILSWSTRFTNHDTLSLSMSLLHFRLRWNRAISWIDCLLLLGIVVFVYALVGVAHDWAGPFRPKTEIQLGLPALLRYSFFSLVRVFFAYGISLALTLV